MVKGVGGTGDSPKIPEDMRELVFSSEENDAVGGEGIANVAVFMAARGNKMGKPVQKGFESKTTAATSRLSDAIFKRLGK